LLSRRCYADCFEGYWDRFGSGAGSLLRGAGPALRAGHASPFHKPITGKWELCDVWVIDEAPLPSMVNGYCYSHDIFYIDKELWAVLQNEYYDRAEKLWKVQFSNRT
jgi:Protein of unknown function (DUF1329)